MNSEVNSLSIAQYVARLEREVQRLRAAPQLPEVPVERVGETTVLVDGVDFDGTDTPQHYRREAARYVALAAFLDAEAAAQDNDDEVPLLEDADGAPYPDVWGFQAREAVARAIASEAENNPESFGYYLAEADAVLAALTAHAVPRAAVFDLAQQWEDDAPAHDARAAQLARGVRPELNEQRRRLVLLAVADELRALAGDDQ